jgi:4-hydroxy-tetrahydrodipicolinate reductase
MALHPEYSVMIEETHHTQKKDAPSGTAITLAEQLIEHLQAVKNWVNQITGKPGEIPVVSKRIDPAAGTHRIRYTSAIDDIEIIHTAHNRQGFAAGAVLAAEFIREKKGCFTMRDVLDL